MPVNSLLIAKEKYSLLNKSFVTTSNNKVLAKLDAFSSMENVQNEFVIKNMIAALEDTVKVLEKKIHNLKNIKEQKEKNVR